MGCGGSSAKTADEPLVGVMPGGGSTATGGGGGHKRGASSTGVTPAKPKKLLVIYDPVTAPFPPSAASLQRKMPGRVSVFPPAFQSEWKRAGDVLAGIRRAKAVAAGEITEPAAPAEAKENEDGTENEDAAEAASIASAVGPPSCVFSSTSSFEDNVVAGPYADPHILAALVTLAAHPNRLLRLFPALDDPIEDSEDPMKKKNASLAGILVGTKVKSNSLAKMTLLESGPKFADSFASGQFQIRLFWAGLWRIFTVDDHVPVSVIDPATPHVPSQPLFASSRDYQEIWMLLIEKALAKVLGSYEDMFNANPSEIYRALTGGTGEILTLPVDCQKPEVDELWSQLAVCWKRADLLSCTTRQLNNAQNAALASRKAQKPGPDAVMSNFLDDHDELRVHSFYSVLDVQQLPAEVGSHRLVLLRNPQGSQRWAGRWCDGADEWAELEKLAPDGALFATKLKMSRKKHQVKSDSSATSAADGIFWVCWEDLVVHFSALFICQVTADQFDICQSLQGEWKGKSAAGKPIDITAVGLTHAANAYGNWLNNPCFRIRNTANKKSTPISLTLSKGAQLSNQLNAAPVDEKTKIPSPVVIGFRLVTNQLNHAINGNPACASPLFGQLQASPLHDELITSKFSSESVVSVTLPSLDPYKDYYLLPYTAEIGVDGDFVLNLWTNQSTILFDACPPLPNNPIELPVVWSRQDRTAAGNLWVDAYLNNPTYKISNTGDEPVKLLLNLVKTNAKYQDLNLNLRVVTNTAPNYLLTTAVGMVSAPAKALVGGTKRAEEKKSDGEAAPSDKKRKQLLPVSGSLSPWFETVDGGTTRWGNDTFYQAQKDYPVVVNTLAPGVEYFIVASTFTAATEGEALLQVYGAALDQVKLERVGPEFMRVINSRWRGVNAAGPARRKKTFLNNPQFCLRHQASGPISIVVSLLLPASAPADLAINISVATMPRGSADPNPFTTEEVDGEKRRQKDITRAKEKAAEAKKKEEDAKKARAQAALLGAAASSSSAQPAGLAGVASLRIKSKPGSNKKGSAVGSNMFADADFGGADSPAADGVDDAIPRVNALTTDFELVTQTTFNGDLYKTARLVHLFVPDVLPNRSYFILPSTSVPGQETDFTIQAFGASPTVELKLEPCNLNSVGDSTIDMSALASRRTSTAASAGLVSHKVKKVVGDHRNWKLDDVEREKNGSTKPKNKHR